MKLLIALVISIGVIATAQQSGENPCHPVNVKQEAGAMECDQIALPPKFCVDCRMSSFSEEGVFPDCTKTMELNPTCLSAMQKYVEKNPCDVNRANHLETYLNSSGSAKEDARLRLDWFGFSVCEQACDCIPQQDADRSTPAFDFARGNCQAHAFHHICQLMPNIKLIRLDDGTPDPSTDSLPFVCDQVKAWYSRTDALRWNENPNVPVSDDVKRFLDGFMRGKQFLELEDFWNQCFDLELGQKRVAEKENLPPPIDKSPGPPILVAPPPPNIAVVSFSLMQAGTQEVLIENISDESEIDISALGTNKLSIRANAANGSSVGSVRFILNGSNIKTDSQAPFSISGDRNGRFKPWQYTVGEEYTLRAIPFTAKGARGNPGAYREIKFKIVNSGPQDQVTSFSLVNAETNLALIPEIQDYATIDVSALGARAVNVRANTSGDGIRSVRFALNEAPNARTENVAPYALAGDINGKYMAWMYQAGQENTVEATPFSAAGGRGTAGTSKKIHFTLV